jgi:hypothetical protein
MWRIIADRGIGPESGSDQGHLSVHLIALLDISHVGTFCHPPELYGMTATG